jgi:hypothetical protein
MKICKTCKQSDKEFATVGAGGARAGSSDTAGSAGGNTTVNIGGFAITATGGAGGASILYYGRSLAGSVSSTMRDVLPLNTEDGVGLQLPNDNVNSGGSTPFGVGGYYGNAAPVRQPSGYGSGGHSARGNLTNNASGMGGFVRISLIHGS